MRIWSLHPRYLDRQGLTACWREALLAQAVLEGATRGYTRHPQLERFRAEPDPREAIGDYLAAVADEASTRSYRFDRGKVHRRGDPSRRMDVASGQLEFEWRHLRERLALRSPDHAARLAGIAMPEPHPLFTVIDGPVASWERGSAPQD